jgi:hypothetical protein
MSKYGCRDQASSSKLSPADGDELWDHPPHPCLIVGSPFPLGLCPSICGSRVRQPLDPWVKVTVLLTPGMLSTCLLSQDQ